MQINFNGMDLACRSVVFEWEEYRPRILPKYTSLSIYLYIYIYLSTYLHI